jgi:hypothetical protein
MVSDLFYGMRWRMQHTYDLVWILDWGQVEIPQIQAPHSQQEQIVPHKGGFRFELPAINKWPPQQS